MESNQKKITLLKKSHFFNKANKLKFKAVKMFCFFIRILLCCYKLLEKSFCLYTYIPIIVALSSEKSFLFCVYKYSFMVPIPKYNIR